MSSERRILATCRSGRHICCQLIARLAPMFRVCIYLSSVMRVSLISPAWVAPSRGARGRSWARRRASFVAAREPLAPVLQQGVQGGRGTTCRRSTAGVRGAVGARIASWTSWRPLRRSIARVSVSRTSWIAPWTSWITSWSPITLVCRVLTIWRRVGPVPRVHGTVP